MNKNKVRFRDRKPLVKVILIMVWTIIGLLGVILGVGGGYIIYVSAQYYRIEDNQDLTDTIKNESTATVAMETSYRIGSYNIGFGAYDADYDFFMDTGYLKDGTYVQGRYAKARSYEDALRNTQGSLDAIAAQNFDFSIIQEIDTDSNRCYHINQYEMFQDGLSDYDSVWGCNFHSAFLAYPFTDMIGASTSGLATFSKYAMHDSVRRSYPVDDSWPTKFFDLDRAFTVTRYELANGKEFVLCNSHMSAYDEGGIIRAQQLTFLGDFLQEEADKGNYVIVGGDFNHALYSYDGVPNEDCDLWFEHDQLHPDWVAEFDASKLPTGYKVVASYNCATCRAAEMPYVEGINYRITIDGFIVSPNIEVEAHSNIDLGFAYSDHNPATMTFKLSA